MTISLFRFFSSFACFFSLAVLCGFFLTSRFVSPDLDMISSAFYERLPLSLGAGDDGVSVVVGVPVLGVVLARG